MIKRLSVLLILISVISQLSFAQSFYQARRDRGLIAIAGVNTSTYYGDLKDNGDILDAKPSVSVGLQYYISKQIAMRGEFSWVTFSGRDDESEAGGRVKRNLSFTSGNYELSFSGVFNLIPQGGRFYQRPTFNVYGMVGIGGLYFNPKAELNGTKYALQPLQTEGVSYSRLTLVIPYGIGAKMKVNPFFNVAVEAGWRKTFSDYLDDVSTTYVDNTTFTNPVAQQLADRRPEIGLATRPAGSIRGNPDKKDAYMLISVRIEYYLPYQLGSNQKKLYNRKRKSIYHR